MLLYKFDKVHQEQKLQPGYEPALYCSDLLPGLDNMIIVDSFDPVTKKFRNWGPFNAFYDLLIRYLFKKYNNVTFKTGFAKAGTDTSLRRLLSPPRLTRALTFTFTLTFTSTFSLTLILTHPDTSIEP